MAKKAPLPPLDPGLLPKSVKVTVSCPDMEKNDYSISVVLNVANRKGCALIAGRFRSLADNIEEYGYQTFGPGKRRSRRRKKK